MSRIVTCGWETNDVNEAGVSTIGANNTLTVVASTPTPRLGGNYCLKVAVTASSVLGATYKAIDLGAPKTEVWIRFALYTHALASTEIPIAQLQPSTTGAQTSLSYNAGDSLLRVWGSIIGSNLLGASSSSMAQDGWHLIEWRTQLLTATTGTTELWLDNSRVINFSGDNSGQPTINVQTLLLGPYSAVGTQSTSTYLAFDDLAVNDTNGTVNNGRCGDGRIVLLTPTGAGSSTVLTRGGTDSGANWSQVDELPPSMTDYVLSANAGDRDLYAMSDLSGSFAAVNVVEAIALAQNSDAGVGSLAPTIKSGSTISEAASQTLGTSAAYVVSRWETDPNTSAAWTPTAVNALEAGPTVR